MIYQSYRGSLLRICRLRREPTWPCRNDLIFIPILMRIDWHAKLPSYCSHSNLYSRCLVSESRPSRSINQYTAKTFNQYPQTPRSSSGRATSRSPSSTTSIASATAARSRRAGSWPSSRARPSSSPPLRSKGGVKAPSGPPASPLPRVFRRLLLILEPAVRVRPATGPTSCPCRTQRRNPSGTG